MANYKWDELSDIYTEPDGKLNKGTIVRINITCDKPFVDELDVRFLKMLFSDWVYFYKGEKMEPFQLIEFAINESEVQVRVQFLTKNNEHDELRLLLKDALDYLNLSHFSVLKINAVIDC